MTQNQLKEMAGRIKKRRESWGFTQESFCEMIGLSASSYTKIENAFQKPSLNTLIKIAQNLDLSLDYIVFGTDGEKLNEPLTMDVISVVLNNSDKDKLRYALDVFSKITSELPEKSSK